MVYHVCFKKKILRHFFIEENIEVFEKRNKVRTHILNIIHKTNRVCFVCLNPSIHRTLPRKSFKNQPYLLSNKLSFFNREQHLFITEGNTTMQPTILYIYSIFHIIIKNKKLDNIVCCNDIL